MSERHTLTEKEFAEAVGLNPAQIGALRRNGQVPHYRVGRRILYSPTHILEFLRHFEIPVSDALEETNVTAALTPPNQPILSPKHAP